MLVKEFMLGNTEIEIYDDAYKYKTKKDISQIIKRIEKIASRSFTDSLNLRN